MADLWLIELILSYLQQTYLEIPKAKRGHCETIFDTIIFILLYHRSVSKPKHYFFPKPERKSKYTKYNYASVFIREYDKSIILMARDSVHFSSSSYVHAKYDSTVSFNSGHTCSKK